MKASTKRQIKENVVCDHIIFKKDGTVAFRQTYFYHNDRTSEKFAEKVKNDLNTISLKNELLAHSDIYRQWPSLSYFEAIFKIEETKQ